MSPSRVSLLLVCGLVVLHAQQTEAKCGRDRQEVRVDNCSGKRCILRRGGSTGITFKFTPEKQYGRLKAKVSGVILGAELPFGGVPSDACSGLTQGTCPLQPGQEYVYRAEIPVSNKYPRLNNIQVKFFLVDANTNEQVACAKILVNLQ